MKEQIHTLSEEMIANLGRLVAIDSQLGTPEEGKPFGAGPAKALEEGLKIAEELGFKTENLDHYCGYAEMGEGEEIVGIAGHLDIVPVGGDWTYDPFKLTRDGDHVYGRGTTDDKGPVLEALYAMKLLRDSGVKLNKRVRLIMGCNEETGSKCMEHYNEVAEELSCGFTSDANFPCGRDCRPVRWRTRGAGDPAFPAASPASGGEQAASWPMVSTPYWCSTRPAARPTNSRSPTGRGQTISCQFSRLMTVVASGFL